MKASQTPTNPITTVLGLALSLAVALSAFAQAQPASPGAAAQPPSIPERVAALKKSLTDSNAKLKSYEWIETTVISLKGKEKSSVQMKCYYGADGKVQKLPVVPPPEEEKPHGIRGKIAESKKEELSDYMKQAVELVRQYLPPDPEAIQKCKEAGNVSIAILEPGKRVRLDFKDYLIPGDQLGVEMTLADDHLAGIAVSTFLDDKSTKKEEKDPITLAVRMGTLDDGATYTEQTTLDAKAKELQVVVTNSGYRKIDK